MYGLNCGRCFSSGYRAAIDAEVALVVERTVPNSAISHVDPALSPARTALHAGVLAYSGSPAGGRTRCEEGR